MPVFRISSEPRHIFILNDFLSKQIIINTIVVILEVMEISEVRKDISGGV